MSYVLISSRIQKDGTTRATWSTFKKTEMERRQETCVPLLFLTVRFTGDYEVSAVIHMPAKALSWEDYSHNFPSSHHTGTNFEKEDTHVLINQ